MTLSEIVLSKLLMRTLLPKSIMSVLSGENESGRRKVEIRAVAETRERVRVLTPEGLSQVPDWISVASEIAAFRHELDLLRVKMLHALYPTPSLDDVDFAGLFTADDVTRAVSEDAVALAVRMLEIRARHHADSA